MTGEKTEIDLQPIAWFGNKKYKKAEIDKVKKLIQSPTGIKRSVISTNNKESYIQDVDIFLDNIKRNYKGFNVEKVDAENVRISKGNNSEIFKVKNTVPIPYGYGSTTYQANVESFSKINSFLYNNMSEEEADTISSDIKIDTYRRLEDDIKKMENKIDVSIESAENDFYDKNYFKGLFSALESSGVSIPNDIRSKLEKGTTTKEVWRGNSSSSEEVPFTKDFIKNAINENFDPETIAKINQYNLAGTINKRAEKIDRAKKLVIENYYEGLPDRERVKEVVRQIKKDSSDKEIEIETTLKLAQRDVEKMVEATLPQLESLSKKYPSIKFERSVTEDGEFIVSSSKEVPELKEIRDRSKKAYENFIALLNKSKYELDKNNSKKNLTAEFLDASKRSYGLIDNAYADFKNAVIQLAGGVAVIGNLGREAIEKTTGLSTGIVPTEIGMKEVRKDMEESRNLVENFTKTKRTYTEAIKEGSFGEFSVRTFSEQAPNIILAVGTSGAGASVGLSNAAISTLVATQFGVTSAGQKYDEITTRQDVGNKAKEALDQLEKLRGKISDEEYFSQKYELERASQDSKISSEDKTLAVIGTGLVEGLVTRFIGTVPNSIKILRDLKKPTNFLDDIFRSNYKATASAFKEFGKSTGGEIIEETSIDLLTQINDYAFLGDQIDLSSLDDVAVTSIITSGAMNAPGTAYSTILTQTNVNRYKNKIKGITDQITALKEMLNDQNLTNIERNYIHNTINNSISGIAEETTNMEADALLLGSKSIQDLITMSGVRNSMLKKAGVENDDSYDIAKVKIDNYIGTLTEDEAVKFMDKMKFIDSNRNDIISSIKYEGAVEKVFGDKGKEIAKNLDPSLTPQQKYVEVYKKVRQDINDNALKEFKDAIQKQTAGQVPVQPETAVSETVEEGTPQAESEVVTEEGIPQEIASLKDDESVLITVKTIDEVPQQFRDRAQESSKTEIKTKKSFFGIPYGPTQKTEVGGGFTYTITGLEAKELATQELQKNAVPEIVTETQEEVDQSVIYEEKIANILIPESSIKQKVYHGSEGKVIGEFKKMNPNIDGIFFSSDIENAKTYGKDILEAYVDLKNPLVIDANGLKFTDDIPVTVIASYPGKKPYETTINLGIDEIVYMVKNGKRKNSFIEIPNREQYDGLVFKNIIDPSLSSKRDVPQDTVVAFENSQIKRADESNTEFTNAVESLLNKTAPQTIIENAEDLAYKPEEVVETTDAAAFADSQAEAITQRKDDKLQVTPLTKDDAQKIIDEGGKLFITEDGKSGAYVTADGYMGGLFKQPGANRTQAAKVLQDARIQAGGKFFDAFGINTESGKGTTLEDIYIKNGFRPVARMTFNPEFAPPGWQNTNLKNRPDNVFFVYDPTYKATKGEGQRIEDYDQAYDLAKNFSPEAAEIESEVQTLRELFKEPEQRKQVENAEKALKAIAPDVKIVVHESEEAYAKATNEQNRAQKTAGEYNPKTKTIHINPAKANARTVAHEAFHAILLSTVKTDAEAQRLTNAMMKAVAKVASPELKDYLDAFASNYDQNIRSEEKLAELVGKLASEYGSLPKPTQNIIKRWLDRLAKMFGLKPFTDNQVIEVLNTIAGKLSRGETISENDISAISEGASTFFSDPTTIKKKQVAEEVKISDTPADLSFVTSKDIIDIDKLINEISSKGQKVWFWVADQLGRGIYNDTKIGTEHFLDAGPSFALDPKNKAKKVIWATGKGEAEVSKLINKSDYIFIISGSPIRSKLFNKRVLNILKDRVGDYKAFKEGVLNSKPTKPFIDVLKGYDSWESLTESPDRKKLLNAIEDVKQKKDTPLKTFLQDNNAFIDLNNLRDGFYAQNDFQMNDVMLVLKPTAIGGKSDHSTYENDILGEVVGVPNKKVNAYDLMPDDIKQKYSDAMTESQKAQVVAPYGIGVKDISPRKQFVGVKANLTDDQKSRKKKAQDMINKGIDPLQTKQQTGFEVGSDGKLRLELDASKAKEIGPGLGHSLGRTTVGEVLEFPDLVKAYPFISDISIFFNNSFGSAGLYDGESIRMNSNLIKKNGNGDHLGTLLHEIQHVIQIKEGFAGGANPSTIRDEVKKAVRNLNNKAINAIQTQVEKLTGIRPELTITEGDRKELTKIYENNEAALIDMLSRYTTEDVDSVVKVIRNYDKSNLAVENLIKKFGMPEKEAVLLNGIHGVFDMKLYEALSGEVEATNVQNRRTMTEAERRNSLAAETETISQLVSIENGGKYINVPINRSEQIRRKQVVNYDNVIKIAKENNISDAAIRKFLQDDQGMTTKQADDAVKNYNEVQRRKGLKVEGVKDPSAITFFGKEVLSENNLKKMYQGLLFLKSARANQPKSMFIGKEDKAGAVEGAVKRAYNTLNKLNRITKKLSKKDLDNVMAELDSYLRGNKEAKLPDNIKKIAFEMRTHLDYLSKKLVEVGAVPDVSFDELSPKKKKELIEKAGSEAEAREDYKSAAENILGNVGEYLNRSFAVHTDKNWKDKVSEKVVEDAKAYLRKSMAKSIEAKAIKENKDFASLLEQEVNAVVDRLLDPNESRSFFNTANASSKNTGILKQKQDIAPEILALMGEQTSPAMNYIISVQKIASLAAQQTFLNNVREKGLGVFLFENEADAPKGFRVKIASEGSKTMNPLNGMYTSPEIAKALNETYKKPEGIIKVVVDFINFLYLKPLGVVKYNKTILSPGTHSKNIIGNGFFMLANGYLNPKDWADAGIVVWNEIKSGDNDALNNKYIEYIEAGVINSSATLNDLKRTLSGIGNKVESEEEFERRVQDKLYGKNIIKKGLKGAEKAYQLEDDYFKIISYEVNKRQYAKALFKNSFENISDKQKQEVIEIAKEVTKNTLPNYERIAAIRDALKILPFGSNFLSFHMEALRTSYNTIDLAFKEIKDPRTAAIGARRLAGISAVIMLSTGVIGSLLGGGDDEDEKDDAIRKLLPHWSENSNIRIVSTKGENIVYQDLSASSPYGAMEKAMNAYSRGEDISDSLKGTFDELFGAFYADDIIVSQAKKYNEVVSSQGFTSREGKEALARGLYETFKPGGLSSTEKIFIDDRMKLIDAAFGRKIELKKEGKVGEAVGQFSGYGNRIVKKNAVIKRKLYEIGSAGFGDFKSGKARSASTDYNNRYRDFLDGKVSEDEVEKAYDRSNLMYKEAMKEAIEIYKAALILDINYFDMVDMMKETGFSKEEIELIDIGETPELKRKGESDSLSPYQKLLKTKSKR